MTTEPAESTSRQAPTPSISAQCLATQKRIARDRLVDGLEAKLHVPLARYQMSAMRTPSGRKFYVRPPFIKVDLDLEQPRIDPPLTTTAILSNAHKTGRTKSLK